MPIPTPTPTPDSVKILEETRVAPSNDSPNSPKETSLQLTFLDMYYLKCPPVECVYFYKLTESTSTPSYFNTQILPSLKESLGLALLHYLPLAGNIKWPSHSPKPFLSYTPDDSISLTIAESTNADNFGTFCSHDMYPSNLLHPLVPPLMISDDIAEILSLQITLFPHQGFSIGISSHHAVVDGKVATMFMKTWAHLHKHRNKPNPCLPSELTLFLDRSLIKDPNGLDLEFLNKWVETTSSDPNPNKRSLKVWEGLVEPVPDDMMRATFVFTRKDIEKLRQKVLLEADDAKSLRLSTFVLIYAYVLTCMVKAKGGKGERPVLGIFGVDFRARLNPPLPTTYFGNGSMYFEISDKASNFMDNGGFSLAVRKVSDLVEKLNRDVLDEADVKGVKVRQFFDEWPKMQVVAADGSPRLGFYQIDFGLGTLDKVELASIDSDESFSMIDSRDGCGGVEISVALPKPEMESFASILVSQQLKVTL